MPCWRGGKVPAPVARVVVGGVASSLALGLAVVLLDQFSKWIVTRQLGPGSPSHEVDLIGRSIGVRYVENTGAAFGLFGGQGMFVAGLAGMLVLLLLVFSRRIAGSSVGRACAIGLVIGGAVGNLIDRARLGYVVDFVAIGRWPTFNVADSAISIGVVVLALLLVRADASELDVDQRAGSGDRLVRPGQPTDG